MKRILITGGSGMLGKAVVREWTGHAILFPVSSGQLDLRDAAAVGDAVRRLAPSVILHTAAYTNVDGAEAAPEEAAAVNDRGTAHLAVAAAACGATLVYVSTDYVFDGTKGAPYVEDDPCRPINVYGRTKLAGEGHTRGVPRHLIVRTQGLFGRDGKSFVASILAAADAGRAISVVDDVTTGVTYAADLARALRRLVEVEAEGTFHACNVGPVVWNEFARAILSEAGRDDVPVARTSSAASGRAARRPAWSYLDTSRYSAAVGEPLPPWRDALRRHLRDVLPRPAGA